jgi:phage-related protein
MQRRKIIFGDYDTAVNGPWTLTEWELSPAALKQNFVEVPGRDGDLDLSTALTDGRPVYGSRTLVATFECSEGTREDRELLITTMVNWLDGWRLDIVLPDDEVHYMTGRVSVARNYNDPAHASVTVTAICDPWRYAVAETVLTRTAASAVQTVNLINAGRRAVVPLLEITAAEGATVLLTFGTASWALSAGTYKLPDMFLQSGNNMLSYSGAGALTVTYREAIL